MIKLLYILRSHAEPGVSARFISQTLHLGQKSISAFALGSTWYLITCWSRRSASLCQLPVLLYNIQCIVSTISFWTVQISWLLKILSIGINKRTAAWTYVVSLLPNLLSITASLIHLEVMPEGSRPLPAAPRPRPATAASIRADLGTDWGRLFITHPLVRIYSCTPSSAGGGQRTRQSRSRLHKYWLWEVHLEKKKCFLEQVLVIVKGFS